MDDHGLDGTEESFKLTTEGRQRRRSMLQELLARQHRLRRRRRRRRQVVIAGVIVAAAVVAADRDHLATTGLGRDTPPSAPRIRTISSSVRQGIVRTINDEQLLDLLDAIDRPAGLIRFEGRTILTSQVGGAGPGTNDDPAYPTVSPPTGATYQRGPLSMGGLGTGARVKDASYDLESSCLVAGLFLRASV